ncbi:hypothetical protein Gotur_000033 [Gossypium turneri]
MGFHTPTLNSETILFLYIDMYIYNSTPPSVMVDLQTVCCMCGDVGIAATITASWQSQLNCVIGAKAKKETQGMEALQRNHQVETEVE